MHFPTQFSSKFALSRTGHSGAQNADAPASLRDVSPSQPIRARLATMILALLAIASVANAQSAPHTDLRGSVLVGYQAWFRCPGDGSPGGNWSHWSKGTP